MMSVMNTVKPYSKKEMLIVAGVLGAILLPLRFLTIEVLGDNWLGALGVITGVTLVMIILAKKKRMGQFGDMFLRTMASFHRSKYRKFIYVQCSFLFVIGLIGVYTVEAGNTTYADEKAIAVAELHKEGIDSYEDVMEQSSSMSAEEHAQAAASMPVLAIKEFKVIAISMAIVNDMLGGWYRFFATLILVESAEVLGLIVITKKIAPEI